MCCCKQSMDDEALIYSTIVYSDRIHKTGMSTSIPCPCCPDLVSRVTPRRTSGQGLILNSTPCIESPELSL